jgi:putative protease
MKEEKIGAVTHYFSKAGAAKLILTDGDLKAGDEIHIKGHTSDFKQVVESMQIDHQPVTEAKKGSDIGMKVKEPVREHDVVYKLIAE